MDRILRKLLFLLLLLTPVAANGLQLFVVEADWCPACHAWKAEVKPHYTPDQEIYLPLIEINITHGIIENVDYAQYYREGRIERLYATPTFFIWDEKNKWEVVRWAGYGAAESWFLMLQKAIQVAKQSIKDCEEFNICEHINLS